MAKVTITYSATIDTGDVPFSVIEKALTEDDGDFDIWSHGKDIKVVDVDLEVTK